MRAPDMGHWRAIKQGERRSFTVFPGKLRSWKRARAHPERDLPKLVNASSILVTRSTAKALA
jgi:hypothetical protein